MQAGNKLKLVRTAAATLAALALLTMVIWAVSGWGGLAYVWKKGHMSIGNGAIDYHSQLTHDPADLEGRVVWRSTNPPSWACALEGGGMVISTWLMCPIWLVSLSLGLMSAGLFVASRPQTAPWIRISSGRGLLRAIGVLAIALALLASAVWTYSYWCSWTYAANSMYMIHQGRFGYDPVQFWGTPGVGFAGKRATMWGLNYAPPANTRWFRAVYPLWPVPLILGSIGGALLYLARPRVRLHECTGCKYDLRGLPPNAPCPECGKSTTP